MVILNMNLSAYTLKIAKAARKASYQMALISAKEKNQVLLAMAKALVKRESYLIKENAKDLAFAMKEGYSKAMVDRLTLNPKRIADLAQGWTEPAR